MGLAALLFQGTAASPSFCLSSTVAREASASPRAKGNKKAQPHHTHLAPRQWPTVSSVDSVQVRLQASASERREQPTSC